MHEGIHVSDEFEGTILISEVKFRLNQGKSYSQYMRAVNPTRNTVVASRLEVADTSAKRKKGLLGRTSLKPGEGLWIIPCEAVHTFGMKFNIDLIYLDRKHRIKKVRSNVPAWRMSGCLFAHSVIELPAGTVHDTLTVAGDSLEFLDEPTVG
jgi:uncharacterized protein